MGVFFTWTYFGLDGWVAFHKLTWSVVADDATDRGLTVFMTFWVA